MIDAKFPLTWLLGTGAAIVFAMGSFSFQISGIAKTVANIEAKADVRDDRSNLMAQSIIALQGDQRTQDAKIDRSAIDIIEVKKDIEEMKRKQVWAPR